MLVGANLEANEVSLAERREILRFVSLISLTFAKKSSKPKSEESLDWPKPKSIWSVMLSSLVA